MIMELELHAYGHEIQVTDVDPRGLPVGYSKGVVFIVGGDASLGEVSDSGKQVSAHVGGTVIGIYDTAENAAKAVVRAALGIEAEDEGRNDLRGVEQAMAAGLTPEQLQAAVDPPEVPDPPPLVHMEPLGTSGGQPIDEARIAELVAEAEAGYDLDKLKPRRINTERIEAEGESDDNLTIPVRRVLPTDDEDEDELPEVVARSSFGTPEARESMRNADPDAVQATIELAKELASRTCEWSDLIDEPPHCDRPAVTVAHASWRSGQSGYEIGVQLCEGHVEDLRKKLPAGTPVELTPIDEETEGM